MATNQTASSQAFALKNFWDDRFIRHPNENRNITRGATDPVGAEKIGANLYFRVLPTTAAQVPNATTFIGTGMTYDDSATEQVGVTPAFSYAAIQVSLEFVNRFVAGDNAAYLAGRRAQLLAGLWTGIETTYAQNATTISVQLGSANLSEALFLQAKGILRGQALEYADMENGNPQMYFWYHPSQIPYVESIPAIMHADFRGDSQNPTVSGLVQKGWGFMYSASNNVYTNAGVAYNILHVKNAFVLGFNTQPKMLDPQPEEASVRYIAIADAGSKELLDECAVIIRSPV